MNLRKANQIKEDVREEFASIKTGVQSHLNPDVTIDHARNLLSEHVPTMVIARIQILLDSLLNYLMEDAVEALADTSTEVKNTFYAQDLRKRIKDSFTLQPEMLQFSFDPRIVAGSVAAGGTFVVGGLIVGLVLGGVVARIIAGIATLTASALAFRVAHSAGTASARRALESDVAAYLAQSEQHVASWLSDVEEAFVEMFDKFASEQGMSRGGPDVG